MLDCFELGGCCNSVASFFCDTVFFVLCVLLSFLCVCYSFIVGLMVACLCVSWLFLLLMVIDYHFAFT